MVHKNFLAGILALALTFGMTLIGCEMTTGGDGNNNGLALNGTWRNSQTLNTGEGTPPIFESEMALLNGSWEGFTINPRIPVSKGSYTTSGDQYIQTITHYHGSYLNLLVSALNETEMSPYEDDEYYPFSTYKDVYKDLMKKVWSENDLPDGMLEMYMSRILAQIDQLQTTSYTYSISGNELTLTATAETMKKLNMGYNGKDITMVYTKQ